LKPKIMGYRPYRDSLNPSRFPGISVAGFSYPAPAALRFATSALQPREQIVEYCSVS
jgi:hypothetical protein